LIFSGREHDAINKSSVDILPSVGENSSFVTPVTTDSTQSTITHTTTTHATSSANINISSSDPHALMRYLRSRLLRNIGGITNSRLYYDNSRHFVSNFPDPLPDCPGNYYRNHDIATLPELCCRVGTKDLIESYHSEVIRGLDTILTDQSIPIHTKLAFFRETRHSYGRSALLLNGGANLGFHLGIVKALLEIDALPQIISGSSVGAIFAALTCSRTDSQLQRIGEEDFIEINFPSIEGSIRRKLKRFFSEGILMDISALIQCVRSQIGDITCKYSCDSNSY
jgi:hypothetical protein